MPPKRTNQFKVMFGDDELSMLRSLCAQQGLTASDYVRQLVRREHAASAGPLAEVAAPKPKPKRK